jgi:cytochrome c-type biogenesis protein CcmH/NrfG
MAAYWADGLVAVGTVGVDWFPWVAFGAAASISNVREADTTAVRRIPLFVQAAVTIAAIVAALSGLIALSANEEAWQARLLWLRRSTASIEHAARATALDPGRAELWDWLGRTHELAGDWRAASAAYEEATQRRPYSSTFWADLARARARQALERDPSSGGGQAAIAAAERGVRADPNDPDPNAVLADVASQFGQGDLALSAAVTAVRLYPIDAAYDVLVLRSARRASDLRSAAAILDQALVAKDSALIRVAAGEIALRLGDGATARIHATRASQLAPNDAEVRNLLRQVGGT